MINRYFRYPGEEPIDEKGEQESLAAFKKQAREKKLCLRCLINSGGRKRNSIAGLASCKTCGGR